LRGCGGVEVGRRRRRVEGEGERREEMMRRDDGRPWRRFGGRYGSRVELERRFDSVDESEEVGER